MASILAPIEPVTLANASTQDLYRELLLRIGEDPTRDGLLRTPERMEKSMAFLTRGYAMDVNTVLHDALFDVDYDEMVIVKDVEFFSMCEHHLLPFFGKAHVAYVPNGQVIGLCKIPRARRCLRPPPSGAGASDHARLPTPSPKPSIRRESPSSSRPQHLCMMMRGVEKQHSATVTSAMLGVFKTQLQTRNEFLSLVRTRGTSL